MGLGDFFKNVGSSRVLTSDEALGVALFMRGAMPHKKLAYPDTKRIGTWTIGILEGLAVKTQAQSSFGIRKARFNVYNPKGDVCLSSVYFVNTSDTIINSIIVKFGVSEGPREFHNVTFTIRKVKDRFYGGHQVYEAVFDSVITCQSDTDNVIAFRTTAG